MHFLGFYFLFFFFFLMIRRPPRSTRVRSSAASDVYKRQIQSPNFVSIGPLVWMSFNFISVSYTHLRAHETPEHLVCRLLLEKKKKFFFFFFLMIRRPPRSTRVRSSAASDVYKRQIQSPNFVSIGPLVWMSFNFISVSYTHLRAHETPEHLVCRLLLEKKKNILRHHRHERDETVSYIHLRSNATPE